MATDVCVFGNWAVYLAAGRDKQSPEDRLSYRLWAVCVYPS